MDIKHNHYLRCIRTTLQQFSADRCFQRASALAYATLLAIVPLVILLFSMFASFQGVHDLTMRIQHHLITYLLPTSQHIIMDYISTLSEKSHSLSILSATGLMITVTALFITMDETFHDIWKIQRKRSHLARLMMFWSLLTLSPILLGLSISITSYFAAIPFIHHISEQTLFSQQIPFIIPWLISSLAMLAMYTTLPNITISMRAATVASLLAGALFELSKLGFAYYVTQWAHYEQLYGALGTLPVFLVWIYLSWVIVLLGAELHQVLQQQRTPPVSTHTHDASLIYVYYILQEAALAFQHGCNIHPSTLAQQGGMREETLQHYCQKLAAHGLLKEEHQGEYPSDAFRLAQDPAFISAQYIAQAIHSPQQNHENARMWSSLSLADWLQYQQASSQKNQAEHSNPKHSI